MKNFVFKILTVFICIIMASPLYVANKRDDKITIVYADSPYYCRTALSTLENANALVYAYDQICNGIENCQTDINLKSEFGTINEAQFEIVLDAYLRDHGEHFWLGNNYTYSMTGDSVTKVSPNYLMTGSELEDAKIAFNNVVNDYLDGISSLTSDYDIEKYFHDRLASSVTYTDSTNAHNAYGALVEGLAVCEGYAEAMQVLLHKAGIKSLLVFGSSINPSTNESEPHAWNMVEVDDNYYHLDLTWNDQKTTCYAYFNVDDNIIKEDHLIDATAYPLPTCNSLDKNYYKINNRMIDTYTTQEIADILKANSLVAEVFVTSNVTDYKNWLSTKRAEIANKLGIVGVYQTSISQLGRCVIFYIDACLHTFKTRVPSAKATCDTDGNIEYYVCNNPSCGKYFSDSDCNQLIANTNSVVIPATGHNYCEKLEDLAHLKHTPVNCLERYEYYFDCKNCDKKSNTLSYFSDKVGEHDLTRLTKIDAVNPTCESNGKQEYYLCICNTAFEDALGTTIIEDLSTYGVIESLGHADIGDDGKCPVCGKMVNYINKKTIKLACIVGGVILVLIVISSIIKKGKRKKSKGSFNRL
jgi:hypothetical protein